jgi:cell division protein FtsX
MPLGKLARLVGEDARRNRRRFVLSAFGIVVGIAAFVFFLGLSAGVRRVVLDIFPLDRVEIVAPKTNLLGVQVAGKLDDAIVARVRARPEVEYAVPRMLFAFPIEGRAELQGRSLRFELVGDGIDPAYVADEPFAADFRDWGADGADEVIACGPPPAFTCPSSRDCDRGRGRCVRRVPVIVSPKLLEIYNTQFSASRGWPTIGGMEQLVLRRAGKELRVALDLGSSMMGEIATRGDRRTAYGAFLGMSDRAIPIGVTVPLGYVRRWNREFVGDAAGDAYSSVVVKTHGKDEVGGLVAWVRHDLKLETVDNDGERFALILDIVTAFFVLIAFVIVMISAINIAHGFFVQVSERRREIGLFRALGATRADVQAMFLGEAALIGVVAGAIGVGLALAAAAAVDWAAPRYLPDFPFKPDSFFQFDGWIWGGGLLFSIVFCVLGGALPAARAAAVAPAQALAQP